ncbi:MAG: pyrroline-5-carboxylate reductase [Magnetococcales bacterium]|nr:pyrroline-5-carboxylate reductase [Magnetococcales bacterium]
MTLAVTVAFLGGGNMATALISGLCQAALSPERIRVAEPDLQRRTTLQERFNVTVQADNRAVLSGADVVVVAVKPGVVAGVLQEVRSALAPHALILSIAAGISLSRLSADLPPGQPVIRAMPNTPALIGAGMTVLCSGIGVDPPLLTMAQEIMRAAGNVTVVQDEKLMDAVTALSGSGPAYLYLVAEALSDGGVACGLPRDLADLLAQQTLLGSSRLLAESGQHPAILKSQVTSPGGTTIAALRRLEEHAVRSAFMEAVVAAWQRSRELNNA